MLSEALQCFFAIRGFGNNSHVSCTATTAEIPPLKSG